MTVLATDGFAGTGQIDNGSTWDSLSDSAWVAGSGVCKVAAGALSSDFFVDYIGATWPNDQYAQVTLVSPDAAGGQGEGYGPACRVVSSGGGSYYRLVGNGSGWELGKFVTGSHTTIATAATPTFANGDVLRMEVQGTSLRMYKNGVQFGGDQTDASIATGNAGMAYSSTETSAAGVDNFEGGDLAGGGTVNTQTLEDTVSVSDSAVQSRVRGRFHEDTIAAVTDGLVASATRGLLQSDAFAVTDGTIWSAIRGRILQETVDVVDEALLRMLRQRLLTDGVDVTDEALTQLLTGNILVRVLSDTLGINDESLRYVNRARLLESFLTLTDESASYLRRFICLTDLLSVADDLTAAYVGTNIVEPKIVIGFDQPLIRIGHERGGKVIYA